MRELIGLLVASRYKVAGPNEAFIVTGRKGKEVRNPETGEVSSDLSGQKVVMGGGVFVIPFIQRLFIMDLSSPALKMGQDRVASVGRQLFYQAIYQWAGDDFTKNVRTILGELRVIPTFRAVGAVRLITPKA